ncbi:hypothetical protein [Actinomadura rubrisoli]|uniref:Carboxypeptidase regulatory-like domain-containing protein n=1 Tax=Actinomadura rubrisoli TaxID=2530368 RepID=A0A4R5BP52_9ACTN|nr:hypothetical protein [Actinomadura rubrisoli]TDD85772.1 hypothetical protein E1298_18285 [Actinomadura rubrisoli]
MNDDDLMAGVRAAFDLIDPVPETVVSAGRSAIGWRMPSARLAGLAADQPERVVDGVRGGPDRSLVFTLPGLSVEIEVAGTGRDREVTGRIVPSCPAAVHVRHRDLAPDGLTTRADSTGLFCLPQVPEGLVSLVLRFEDAASVVTSWVRL